MEDYRDSQVLLKETYYRPAKIALDAGDWGEARRLLAELGDYLDSQLLYEEATYNLVMPVIEQGNWDQALSIFGDSPRQLLVLTCPPPPEPSQGDTWERCSDSAIMVYVPGGSFMMGSMEGESDESPVHEVVLTSFWLDKTEVTNSMYTQCVAVEKCRSSDSVSDSEFNGENQPIVRINWNDAEDYCNWVGGKLPDEAVGIFCRG